MERFYKWAIWMVVLIVTEAILEQGYSHFNLIVLGAIATWLQERG